MFDMDKYIAERQQEEEIRCPHCEKIFYVIEKVRRTFEVHRVVPL